MTLELHSTELAETDVVVAPRSGGADSGHCCHQNGLPLPLHSIPLHSEEAAKSGPSASIERRVQILQSVLDRRAVNRCNNAVQ